MTPREPAGKSSRGGRSVFTYWIGGPAIPAGMIFTQAPNDSGVTNFVATIDPATRFVTPIAIGFGKATGMLFNRTRKLTERLALDRGLRVASLRDF